MFTAFKTWERQREVFRPVLNRFFAETDVVALVRTRELASMPRSTSDSLSIFERISEPR